MTLTTPLPANLVSRYHGWKATTYQANRAWYRRLASSGQHPRAMVISCCDSRVPVTSIFGADEGEFFIHRNIAGLLCHSPLKPSMAFWNPGSRGGANTGVTCARPGTAE